MPWPASPRFPRFSGLQRPRPLSHGFLSEMLTPFGWSTFAIGKWHLTPAEDMSLASNRKWGRSSWLRSLLRLPWRRHRSILSVADLRQSLRQGAENAEEGYHNVPDLTEKAKEFIADVKQVAPDRPFFLYYCPGATHAPHHVPKDWIAKYKGKFDAGWDDYREKALVNQIEMGICPKGTKLSPRDEFVPEWAKLTNANRRNCTPTKWKSTRRIFPTSITTLASWSPSCRKLGSSTTP